MLAHVSSPTVPAGVTRGLFKPFGCGSKGNALKDVHVMFVSKANVGTLHHPSLGVNHTQLQKKNNKKTTENHLFVPLF